MRHGVVTPQVVREFVFLGKWKFQTELFGFQVIFPPLALCLLLKRSAVKTFSKRAATKTGF
jgi:hypothetical protein